MMRFLSSAVTTLLEIWTVCWLLCKTRQNGRRQD